MHARFSHDVFIKRGEIVNVVFDLLRNESTKSHEMEKRKLKSCGRGQPSFLLPAAHDRSISSSVLGLLVS